MPILIRRRLEEAHCGKVAGLERVNEIMGVVLVVRRAVPVGPNCLDGLGTNVIWVRRRLVVLKRFVMRQIIALPRIGQGRRTAPATCRSVWIHRRKIEATLKEPPRYLRLGQQVADVAARHMHQGIRRAGAHIARWLWVRDQCKPAVTIRYDATRCILIVHRAIRLAGG